MPLPEDFDGSAWTPRVARTILPWLIWLAKHHETVFYSELDSEVVARGVHTHVIFVEYGHPAGTIGNALLEIGSVWQEEIPPINALVVAKTGKRKGLPGDGCDWYLERFLNLDVAFDDLPIEDQRAIVGEVQDQIFSYRRWDDVLAYVADVIDEFPELAPFDGQFRAIPRLTRTRASRKRVGMPWEFVPPPNLQTPKPESLEHRALKRYVADHPECVGLPMHLSGKIEHTFGSGDRADVLFTLGEKLVAVEIKSKISPDPDICKGVFQCVKYRSLVRAHQKLKRVVPNGEAILALGRKCPPEVRRIADDLGISCFDEIDPSS